MLVDDELSTGRTALNVIEALHADRPRDAVCAGRAGRCPLAGADDGTGPQLAARLGCRIDVVCLVRGRCVVPGRHRRAGGRATGRVGIAPAIDGRSPSGRRSRIALPWPGALPHGGRHGFRRRATGPVRCRGPRRLPPALATAVRRRRAGAGARHRGTDVPAAAAGA